MHFPIAQRIYKVDEDIFVTKNFFSNTMKAYADTEHKDSLYKELVFVAPLIPINSFGYALVLKYLNLESEYSSRFENVHIGGPTLIGENVDAARIMWGEGGYVPQIDEIDEIVSQNN